MFEMILFGLVVFCAGVILLCKYVFKSVPVGGTEVMYISEHEQEPWYLDYARSFFPVLLIVFLLRGLIAEPFRIPSGSMLPTLEVGDFILVNKYRYGVRLPILHNKIFPVSDPQRGDIMVFRVPLDNQTHYIKRVIGVPGDTIEYRQKRLFINGEAIAHDADGEYQPFSANGRAQSLSRFTQQLPADGEGVESEMNSFSILHNRRKPSRSYRRTVPEGHYFMMGDNRDNSSDSRVWGMVPEKNIVGEAFFIWFHYNGQGGGFKFSRVGEDI